MHRAATWGELERLLADREVQDGKGFKMIEVIMTREDAPESLKKLVQTVQKRNSGVPDAKAEGARSRRKLRLSKLVSSLFGGLRTEYVWHLDRR